MQGKATAKSAPPLSLASLVTKPTAAGAAAAASNNNNDANDNNTTMQLQPQPRPRPYDLEMFIMRPLWALDSISNYKEMAVSKF